MLMSHFVNNNCIDVLLHCHSVRHFDPTVKISREELQKVLAGAITAPSACNLQP